MEIDVKDLMDCIKNQTKTKVLLLLKQSGPSTPKELLKASEDIPQTTLYRVLKNMEAAGIIKVAAETPVRAMIEKTYALSEEFLSYEEKLLDSNDAETYFRLFHNFVLELLKDFEAYSKKDNIHIANDGSSFNAVPVYATAKELQVYSQKIKDILSPAMQRTSQDQTLHTLAMIVTPPADH